MNLVQSAIGVVALVGAAYGSVTTLDNRYTPLAEWKSFQWTQIKKELREIEKDLVEAEYAGNDALLEALEEDYEELLEYLCMEFPEDRECEE
jgi:hypothetical protein